MLWLKTVAAGIVFTVLMLILRTNMIVNIALTVLFVFVVFEMIYRYAKKVDKQDIN
jgi:hypothetical protein